MTQPELTALDHAHAAMEAAPEDDTLRLRFFERFVDNELFVLLEAEAEGDNISPQLFPLEDGPVLLVFDRLERLSGFAPGHAPYAGMSGRVLVEMLKGQGIGVGLNLETGPSAMLLPSDAVDWLAGMVETRPAEVTAMPERLDPPKGLPEQLLTALDAKLAAARGLAARAWLTAVTFADGGRGHLLAFVDAIPGAEPALARAVGEALAFSGLEAGALDVAFFRAGDPVTTRLERVGLRFDLPAPETAGSGPAAPGMDPDRPPVLR